MKMAVIFTVLLFAIGGCKDSPDDTGGSASSNIQKAEAGDLFAFLNVKVDDVEGFYAGQVATDFSRTYSCVLGGSSTVEGTGSTGYTFDITDTPSDCSDTASTGRKFKLVSGSLNYVGSGSSSSNYTVTYSGTITTDSEIKGACVVNYTKTVASSIASFTGTICDFNAADF